MAAEQDVTYTTDPGNDATRKLARTGNHNWTRTRPWRYTSEDIFAPFSGWGRRASAHVPAP